MERLEKDVSDVGVLKRRLLQACCLAARSGSQTELFYTILRMVSYELDAQAYLPLLSEIEKINQTNQEKKQ